jgi:asparagine synthase (glutamine-hydrolysing)
MCGIVAVVTSRADGLEPRLRAMNEALTHRGPDDCGLMVVPEHGVGMAMRRLSIVDVGGGRQPMWDERRQHAVVFNGEVYNAEGLRQELLAKGHVFQTHHSDTEVLVHGYEEWGTELFIRLNGMFALAIWDRPNGRVVLGRDPTGEKPLYVGRIPGGFAVASELKALLAHPGLDRTLDLAALEQYLSFDFILGPRTILAGTQKLPAGHYAVLTAGDYRPHRYWSLSFVRADAPESHLVAQLDDRLDEAVASRLVSDVPLGLFLSGGLDSTTVGYYMRRHSERVHSFSIGFDDPAYDESRYARLAAGHLGTRHHLEVFSMERIRELVPRVADILDEPMADQSIFPTYLLSCFARRTVKVALGGDGGDELLMGYRTYQVMKVAWQLQRLPGWLRRALAAAGPLGSWTPIGRKLRYVVEGLDQPPLRLLLAHLGSYHGNARWVLTSEARNGLPASVYSEPDAIFRESLAGDAVSVPDATIAAYVRGYLQEDILVKVDRASMATSLEVRAPLLDPRLIAFLGAVPPSLKLRGLTGKYLLRRLMRGRLPAAIIDRPKQGFGVPLNAWLRTVLAPLLRERLEPGRLRRAGVLEPAVVGALVEDHLAGRRELGQQLWPLLLFQLWSDRWLA